MRVIEKAGATISLILLIVLLAGCASQTMEMTISSVKREKCNTPLELSIGEDLIIVTGKITNQADTPEKFYFSGFKLVDSEGDEFAAAVGSEKEELSLIGGSQVYPTVEDRKSSNYRLVFIGKKIGQVKQLVYEDPTGDRLVLPLKE